MKRFVKHGRERGLELHVLVLEGMMETESVGMKAKATEAIVGGAIFLVAHDGMPKVLSMDTDLVLAASFKVEIHQ